MWRHLVLVLGLFWHTCLVFAGPAFMDAPVDRLAILANHFGKRPAAELKSEWRMHDAFVEDHATPEEVPESIEPQHVVAV